MSPLSRYLNVFMSPGAVFEDIRRDWRGWWMPILIGAALTTVMAVIYVNRYAEFQGEIAAAQVRDSPFLKLAPVEAQDKIVQTTRKNAEVVPAWQLMAQQAIWIPFGTTLVVWFFTFLYGLIALAMGWLGETRASRRSSTWPSSWASSSSSARASASCRSWAGRERRRARRPRRRGRCSSPRWRLPQRPRGCSGRSAGWREKRLWGGSSASSRTPSLRARSSPWRRSSSSSSGRRTPRRWAS